jgi:D-glycero-alpha-D-manno-heptose-7-phosphate kinase
MIGTRTPFRISFAGGGSDLKDFYSKEPGCVISTTINKYMYIFVHPYFDEKIQVKYSRTELVDQAEEIKHPIAREVVKKFQLNSIDINSIADIPSGTGLGSSSSYTVGLLHAMYAYCNKYASSAMLARDSCSLEIDILGEPIGKQDQYAAAYGGLNAIRFFPDESVDVEPIILSPGLKQKLQNNLLIFYTDQTRNASDVLTDQKRKMRGEKQIMGSLSQMVRLADQMKKSLIESDLDSFGRILHQNWELKKKLSNKISGDKIDEIYEKARQNGALGGKILGAGGGGFLLFYCDLENQGKLRNALRDLKELDFEFEGAGSKVIYVADTNTKSAILA